MRKWLVGFMLLGLVGFVGCYPTVKTETDCDVDATTDAGAGGSVSTPSGTPSGGEGGRADGRSGCRTVTTVEEGVITH